MFSFSGRTYDRSEGGGGGGIAPLRPVTMRPPRKPVVGLALGAGAARGWSHIGILRELSAQGIVPDVVAGTSIGAVVGGCYVADRLDNLEAFARSLTKRRVFSLMDLTFSGAGLIGGGRLKTELDRALGDTRIEDVKQRFGAVATEIGSGHEIWLTKGHMCEAVRASYALPAIFEPVRVSGRWLFDGALVNPVPVTVCRALGADIVISVNLIADTLFRGTVISDHQTLDRTLDALEEQATPEQQSTGFFGNLRGNRSVRRQFQRGEDGAPGMAAAMMDAFNITQDRIARSRLAGDPPDVTIHARLGKIGLFDFHRAEEMIAIGREAVRKSVPDILEHIASVPQSAVGPEQL